MWKFRNPFALRSGAEATVKAATAYALEETKARQKAVEELDRAKSGEAEAREQTASAQQSEARTERLQKLADEKIAAITDDKSRLLRDAIQRACDVEEATVLATVNQDRMAEEIGQLQLDRERALEGEAEAKANEARAHYLQDLADEQIAVMTEAHVTRWRIGSLRLDPHRLTADLRRVVPSITVEQEGNLFVIYATKHLDQADFNRVQAEIQSLFTLDRT